MCRLSRLVAAVRVLRCSTCTTPTRCSSAPSVARPTGASARRVAAQGLCGDVMLSVDVLPVLPLARVRARVEVEGAWTLTGASGEDTWQVAEGEGPTWLSDPWAPLNQAVTYTLPPGRSGE